MNNKKKEIMRFFDKVYPNAECALLFSDILSLTVAVILSAQTTDEKVNSITPILCKKYQKLTDYATAKAAEIEKIIKPLGLFRMKAKNLIGMAQFIIENYDSVIPSTIPELVKIPGIGRKTANVIISVGFNQPGFAVDTHVARISKRLTIVDVTDNPIIIETKLKKYFPQESWSKLHHQFIAFGRDCCTARSPKCIKCSLYKYCKYDKKIAQ
jgi:endonuclease III